MYKLINENMIMYLSKAYIRVIKEKTHKCVANGTRPDALKSWFAIIDE